jgi:SAM-dependent methyltransferase
MNYETIFRARGASYEQAMRAWPEARREEFLRPLACLAPQPGERVADIPAGGGYLRRYLPAGCGWLGHEPCASFQGEGASDSALLPLPWADATVDAAISIAGVHHLADKGPLFREISRVLRPAGRFVLADVEAASPVARFLDGFVGRHNSTGHEGHYLGEPTLAALAAAGLEVTRSVTERYCWWFDERRQAGDFCRLLFDVRGLDADAVADAVEEYLGFDRHGDRIGMQWELLVATCRRR